MELQFAEETTRSYPEAEYQMRRDLAAVYRLVALCGMDDSIYTRISARVPGTKNYFPSYPFGMLFRDITASSLVGIDLEGRILDERSV